MRDQRFTELLGKTLAAEISSEEHKEFMALLAESPAYRQEYDSLNTYFDQPEAEESAPAALFERIKGRIDVAATQESKAIPEKENSQVKVQPTEMRPLAQKKKPFQRYQIAAILVFCMGIALAYQFFFRTAGQPAVTTVWKTVRTPAIKKQILKLPDGTMVTMNSESELRYEEHFNHKNRTVYLSGEAFFDVKKDSTHPFIIHTGKMSITVLGTSFNVKAYQNDPFFETSLLKGAIQINLNNAAEKPILLKPKQKFTLANTDSGVKGPAYHLTELQYLASGDTSDGATAETSWINNKLVFRDEPFNLLANSLSRWYGLKVIFQKENIKSYRFTGFFEKETVNEALKALQMIEPFQYKIADKTIYIY